MGRAHRRCSNRKHNYTVSGGILNRYYKTNSLSHNFQYKVCYTIVHGLTNKEKKRNAVDVFAKKTKRIRVKYESFVDIIDIEKENEENIQTNKRKKHNSTIHTKLSDYSKQFNMPYKTLSAREQRRRKRNLTCMLISACSWKKEQVSNEHFFYTMNY